MLRFISPLLFLFISSCNNLINDPIETYFNKEADIIIRSSLYETLLSDLEQIIYKHDALKLSKHEIEFITNIIKKSAIDSTIYLSLFKKKKIEFQILGRHRTQTLDSIIKQNKRNKNLIVNHSDSIWEAITNNLKIISNNKLYLNKCTDESKNTILNKFDNSNENFVFSKNNTFSNKFLPETISKLLIGDSYFSHSDHTNKIYINGIISYSDSIPSIFKALKQSKNYASNISGIIPYDSDYFASFTFDAFESLNNVIGPPETSNKNDTLSKTFFTQTNEFGILGKKDELAVAFNFPSSNIFENQTTELKNFRGHDIFKISDNQINNLIKHISNNEDRKNNVGCFLDGYLIITPNVNYLKEIVEAFTNRKTIKYSSNFTSLLSDLSDESSVILFRNKNIIDSENNSNDFASILQFVNNGDFYHSHMVIAQQKKQTKVREPEIFLKLNTELPILKYQYVNNHITKSKDLLVQDINYNLHRYNLKGNKLWSINLKKEIVGSCSEIDVYKNGRIQTAFATEDAIHVIDLKGKNVSGFPIKVKKPITHPLSVFDYEKTKNYRLLITQNNALVMFNSYGKRVKGFDYNIEKSITSQPQHIRISNKDYIVFSTSEKLKIISRTGKDRIRINNKINIIENSIFKYNNHIIFNENNKSITKVNTKGVLTRSPIENKIKTNITATSKTLVMLTENILSIKNNKIVLDYGNYTKPKIFYINDKLYISTTDLQTQRVLLFDSKGNSIGGFPVYGTSVSTIDDIDNDSSLELAVTAEANQLLIYKFN